MADHGLHVAHPYGVVELTPNHEYLVVTELFGWRPYGFRAERGGRATVALTANFIEGRDRYLADRLAADGHTVVWGRADPVGRAVRYAAISQVLAGLPGHHTLRTLYDAPSGLDVVRNDVYRPVAQLLEAQCADHQMYGELGCVGDLAATEAEMRRQGIRVPTRRRADRFALTDAEQRVAALVAEGLSNRLIAERLAYSVKTIEAYLSRIYAKTGCRNRVDLARRFAGTPA